MSALHSKFGNQLAIEQQLIRPVVERAMLATGPLMSSKESSASRRNDLLSLIEDQMVYGVYKTTSTVEKVKDAFSNEDQTVTVVKPIADATAPGGYSRQEESPIIKFGIHVYSFNINAVKYEDKVEKQIESQQELAMMVQTSMAKAKQSEQEKITVEQQGQTNVAKAKYEAEVGKQTAVTEAEKKVAVATLDVKAADLYKQEQTLIGEGDAARRSKAQAADGQLDKRLAAWVEVQKAYADAMGKQSWVPQYQMGGSSASSGATSAQEMISLLTAKTARDLALDPSPGGPTKK
jgi:hypothetical protein